MEAWEIISLRKSHRINGTGNVWNLMKSGRGWIVFWVAILVAAGVLRYSLPGRYHLSFASGQNEGMLQISSVTGLFSLTRITLYNFGSFTSESAKRVCGILSGGHRSRVCEG